MRYLVMECRPGYAIVMDEGGRFQKVVNLGYEVGQKITKVIIFEESMKKQTNWKRTLVSVAAAACLCLVLLGSYQTFLLPYGTVRIQINPDVLLSVNSNNQVIKLEGLNEDGETLITDYKFFWKKMDVVSDELADLAVEYGYLSEGGRIVIDIESEHENWKVTTEKLLISELTVYLNDKIHVELKSSERLPEQENIIIQPGESSYNESDYEAESEYEADSVYEEESEYEADSVYEEESEYEADSVYEESEYEADSVYEEESEYEADSVYEEESEYEADSVYEEESEYEAESDYEEESEYEAESDYEEDDD